MTMENSNGLRRAPVLKMFNAKRESLRRAYPADNDGDEGPRAAATDNDGDETSRLRRMPSSTMKR